ncbi:MAG: TetR/AcrR family transcriptional regulator [Myxococcales bacterium]|nr:TetR/AcrR family transcriptional regulator [Myxococcales bacterium]
MGKGPVKREIKQERAARTREEILEAAIKLFARRGILATTMSELAKAIRMTPGALYWHFPTKEDLLLSAIEELHQRYIREFVDLLSEGRKLPARQQLEGFFERTQSFLRYHREYGIFFGMVAAEAAETNERVAAALRDALLTYTQVVAGIIKHGQNKTGEFRRDLDPQTLAHALMGAHMGMIVHHHLFRDTVHYDPIMNALDQLVVDGIRPKGAG